MKMKKIIFIILVCLLGCRVVKANSIGKIEVYYINTMGEYLLETKTYQGEIGKSYNIVAPEIYGHYLVRVDGDEYGVYTKEPKELYYMYDEEFTLPDNIYTKAKGNYKVLILLCSLILLIIIKFL